jgi:hypothetical protein
MAGKYTALENYLCGLPGSQSRDTPGLELYQSVRMSKGKLEAGKTATG